MLAIKVDSHSVVIYTSGMAILYFLNKNPGRSVFLVSIICISPFILLLVVPFVLLYAFIIAILSSSE
jgi:hypothetical protein